MAHSARRHSGFESADSKDSEGSRKVIPPTNASISPPTTRGAFRGAVRKLVGRVVAVRYCPSLDPKWEGKLDISWGAIGKVLIAGLGTYVLLPAALVLRDFVLWRVIDAYILNRELRSKIEQHADLVHMWNKEYAVDRCVRHEGGKTTYTINGEKVTPQQWEQHRLASDRTEKSIEEIDLYIRRKSNFLNWLMRHYKQDATNPIPDWFQNDVERLKKRDVEKTGDQK